MADFRRLPVPLRLRLTPWAASRFQAWKEAGGFSRQRSHPRVTRQPWVRRWGRRRCLGTRRALGDLRMMPAASCSSISPN